MPATQGEVRDPQGNAVSRRLVRTLGHGLGMDGGAEALHYLLELDPGSPAFAHDLAAMLPFNSRNPIYAVLHESSYSDGGATRWSSQRVAPDDFGGDSLLLTGEHIFPWHFEDTACPAAVPRGRRRSWHEHPWPRLYDADVLVVRGRAVCRGDLRRRPLRSPRVLRGGRR